MKRFFTLCLAFVLLSGCASAPTQAAPMWDNTFFAMDTVMNVRIYAGGDETLLDAAEDRVKELEALWSVTDPGSEI